MALVKFYDMSVEKYNALVMKDASALYFLDDGSLYKGSLLMTNIKFVHGFPSSPSVDTLYIDAMSGMTKYYTGEEYIDITKQIVESINNTNTHQQIPTAQAVREYADSKINRYANLALFPAIGVHNSIYLDESQNKTYMWDNNNLIYKCIGSNYEEIKVIDANIE